MSDFASIDLVSISAYSDKHYRYDRELWRSFLGYTTPKILPLKQIAFETAVKSAVVDQLAALVSKNKNTFSLNEKIRSLSISLAEEISSNPNFGLASFFEGKLCTKHYKVLKPKKISRAMREDFMLATWLSEFHTLKKEKKFLKKVALWKTWFESYDFYKKTERTFLGASKIALVS